MQLKNRIPSLQIGAYVRMQRDLAELDLPATCETVFLDPNDLLSLQLVICPDEGYYCGGRFQFSFNFCHNYPYEPPKVKCDTPIYHPNINLEGKVCLNILREDWKPVLTINSIVYGLIHLLLEPNAEDPLNKDAADVLRTNPARFQQNVSRAMQGDHIGDVYFPACLK